MPKNETEPAEEKSVGPLAEQESLLSSGLKRMLTQSNAVKYKAHKAMDAKIHGIVASRKQVSTPSGKTTVSTKGPSKKSVEKSISLKR